jgi:hypothetical protein
MMMSKLTDLLGRVVMVAACTVLISNVAHAEDRRVKLINSANEDIVEFRASNVNDRYYGEDLLHNYVVHPGYWLIVNTDDGTDRCVYDFKTVMRSGQVLYEHNVNVCVLETYRITSR